MKMKMKKMIMAAMAGLMVIASAPATAAVSVSSIAAPAVMNTAGVTYNFDTTIPAFAGGALASTTNDQHARPVGSTGNYFAVGPNNNSTVARIFLNATSGVSQVSFLFGSLDDYNSLQFFGADGVIGQLFTGSDIAAPKDANGNRTSADTNRLVTFNFTGADQAVKGIKLNSGTNALEIDNITVTAVPEPATWAMMFLGFGMLGAAVRYRKPRIAVKFA